MVKSKKDEIYTTVIHEVKKLLETNEAQGRGSNTSHHFSNSNLPRWDSPGRHSEVTQKKPPDQWFHIPYPLETPYAHHGAGICTPTFTSFLLPSFVGNYIPAPWFAYGISRIRVSTSHEKKTIISHHFTRDLEEKTQVLDRVCGLYA